MLKLVDIKKDYVMTDETVHALKGVSVNFRRNEFVSILGPSGCGKTTLLNIIGGLDRYSDGDLIIEGKSTKNYKAGDWDTYRNHSIGFIFQSYNLIGHISILKNVELALTISGVSKKERKERAEKALELVGLGGHGKKKPNQLSGGQMQRVAIARALINNPEIVLADEPTGALDSETSVQIMELLKEVAKDRLVIMVTHNPELAKLYATRTIKMKDGHLLDDDRPYEGESEQELAAAIEKRKQKNETKGTKRKTSMSFWTALTLSFNNLMTKKGRTALISLTGSIGIIGITLILSLSNGFNNYILDTQTNAMSSYPLAVSRYSSEFDPMQMMGSMMQNPDKPKYPKDEMIGQNAMLTEMISQVISVKEIDTKSFKEYIELPENAEKFADVTNDIRYTYGHSVNFYLKNDEKGNLVDDVIRLAPIKAGQKTSFPYYGNTYRGMNDNTITNEEHQMLYDAAFPIAASSVAGAYDMLGNYGNAYSSLSNNVELLHEQFEILDDNGRFPENMNEIVIQVDEYNQIPDIFLYAMGLKDISYMMSQYIYSMITNGSENVVEFLKPAPDPDFNISFDDIKKLRFSAMLSNQRYDKIGENHYELVDKNTPEFLERVRNESIELRIVGIVRPRKGVSMTSMTGVVGYHPDLYRYLAQCSADPTGTIFEGYDIIKDQVANPTIDMLTGKPFEDDTSEFAPTLESRLDQFGQVQLDRPEQIQFYPKSFSDKAKIVDYVDEYNKGVTLEHRVRVSDTVGAMLDSVQMIVDSVTYVLIAFVSISLVVSSIMIGIITYVSVLERTKEIGVLRSIGARKRDIATVFNAETLIIGLAAGLLGIGIGSILNLPIMLIINALTDIGLHIIIPWYGALILPAISVCMTLLAGLIPSSIAAKRDPVIALRSE